MPDIDRAICDSHIEVCDHCQAVLDKLTDQTDWFRQFDLPGPSLNRQSPAQIPSIPGIDILEEAGRGGHGVVYRAIQRGLGRVVAVKVLRHGFSASMAERQRLVEESVALARLRHPNIVQVYDCGEVGDVPYVVMEWMEGGRLSDVLGRAPLSLAQAVDLIETLARAVHAAHEARIVHRDLKPANVLLDAPTPGATRFGTPKVSDFGLAKFLDMPTERTPTVAILGTPSYMAPEQSNGESRQVGPAADIYALGAIFYELLTGRPPFVADTPFETLIQVWQDEPIPPRQIQPRVPRDLETICLHCLHKAPNRRYETALKMAEDIRRFREHRPIVARPVGMVEKTVKWIRRHRWRSVSLTAIAASIVTAAIWVNSASRQARARALVDGLLACEPAQAERLLAELAPIRASAIAYLREKAHSATAGSRERLSACLALLPSQPGVLGEILRYVPTATPAELLMIRTNIKDCPPEYIEQFWIAAGDPKATLGERLRTATMLASYSNADPRWNRVAADIAAAIVVENPNYVGEWTGALRPLRTNLVAPLVQIAEDPNRSESERTIAAGIVSNYAVEGERELALTFVDLDSKPALALLPAIKGNSVIARELWAATLQETAPADADEPIKDTLSQRRVRAAIGLWHLNDHSQIERLLAITGPDVRDRHYLMKLLSEYGVDPEFVVAKALQPDNPTTRRSALIALGDYSERQFPSERRAAIRPELERLFEADTDPGVHSVIDWLIGQAWGDRNWSPKIGRSAEPVGDRRWYTTPFGATMAVVRGPVESQLGSDPKEPHHVGVERKKYHRIAHSFAIATREVTVQEFQEFLKAHPNVKYETPDPDDRQPNQPVRRVRWHAALQYCRWLCERDGLPESEIPYPAIPQITDGVTFPPRFLERTGYRLPTEEEWEFACRSGTTTPRFYGFDPKLLTRYGWAILNSNDSCYPGGRLRPNDLGLFDIYGNVWEWTQAAPYESVPGRPDLFQVQHRDKPYAPDWSQVDQWLAARGGSYIYHSPFVRSGKRYFLQPAGDSTVGFRIARTISTPAKPTGGDANTHHR